jgi:hypothetical protein
MRIRRRWQTLPVVGAVAAALVVAAPGGASKGNGNGNGHTGGLPQGSEPVKLNPADFTTRINNPYWPMKPGSRWV